MLIVLRRFRSKAPFTSPCVFTLRARSLAGVQCEAEIVLDLRTPMRSLFVKQTPALDWLASRDRHRLRPDRRLFSATTCLAGTTPLCVQIALESELEKRRLRRLQPCVIVRYAPSSLELQEQAFRSIVRRNIGSGVARRIRVRGRTCRLQRATRSTSLNVNTSRLC